MGQNLGQIKVKRIFFENPTKKFHIREIARMLKLSKTSVALHVARLLKKKIILSRKRVFREYYANESSKKYRFYKRIDALERIFESGLIEALESLNPTCIVLFGSFAKAEYDKNSDIDIFMQTNKQEIDLTKFEKKLKHKINILFEPDINKLSRELLNNIINGVKLGGYLKIK